MSSRESWDLFYARDDRPWKGGTEAKLQVEGPVLELGVGNGKGLTVLSYMAEPIGLDFSRQALRSCRRWHALPLVQGNVTALPFRDGCFDLISASHLLGHLLSEDRVRAADEMVRVLGRRGAIYLNVFGEEDMRYGNGRVLEERTFERGNGIFCHYFTPGELESLFPSLTVQRSWERRVSKRYHGKEEIRQERRALLLLE